MKIGRKVTAFIIFSVLTGSWAVFAQSKISASNGVSEITGETDISKFVPVELVDRIYAKYN